MRASPLVMPALALLAAACSRSGDAPAPPPAPRVPHARPGATDAAAEARETAGPGHYGKGPDVLSTSLGDVQIVPIYHGSLLFELAGKAYYVDPTHEGSYDGLPLADVIFITHPHPDHLDPGQIERLRKAGTLIVGPPSVAEKLEPRDKPGDSTGLVVMKNWDVQSFGGIEVEALPMYNLKRGPIPGKVFHEKGWGEGFIFTFGDKRVYVSGDTECTPEMRALKNIDVAFVCMNLPYTMTPREAAECVDAFSPKVLYPYHYRGSDVGELARDLAPDKRVEVRRRDWY
jgi:L-ascorbate metabolism protein UlaG (beta-lactamase superfamily)